MGVPRRRVDRVTPSVSWYVTSVCRPRTSDTDFTGSSGCVRWDVNASGGTGSVHLRADSGASRAARRSSYAFVLGAVGVLLVLEATRRAISLWMMVIVAAFVVYARFGVRIPQDAAYIGVLSIPELSWPSIIQNLCVNGRNTRWSEMSADTVSVQFYLERDLYIFGGVFVLFGLGNGSSTLRTVRQGRGSKPGEGVHPRQRLHGDHLRVLHCEHGDDRRVHDSAMSGRATRRRSPAASRRLPPRVADSPAGDGGRRIPYRPVHSDAVR